MGAPIDEPRGPNISASHLVLIPSSIEWQILDDLSFLDRTSQVPGTILRPCGVGLVAAAVQTARWLAELQPARVTLIGIAGSLAPDRCVVGQAYYCQHTIGWGIGIGQGTAFRNSDAPELAKLFSTPRCNFFVPEGLAIDTQVLTLGVSVCSASGCAADSVLLQKSYPAATFEEMEGWSVASACAAWGIPCSMIRGISNVAGDRRHQSWQTREALANAVQLWQHGEGLQTPANQPEPRNRPNRS